MTVSVRTALLLNSLLLAAAGCNPNLIGAPCAKDDQCPSDQYCNLATQKCTQGSRTGTGSDGGTAQDGGTGSDGGMAQDGGTAGDGGAGGVWDLSIWDSTATWQP